MLLLLHYYYIRHIIPRAATRQNFIILLYYVTMPLAKAIYAIPLRFHGAAFFRYHAYTPSAGCAKRYASHAHYHYIIAITACPILHHSHWLWLSYGFCLVYHTAMPAYTLLACLLISRLFRLLRRRLLRLRHEEWHMACLLASMPYTRHAQPLILPPLMLTPHIIPFGYHYTSYHAIDATRAAPSPLVLHGYLVFQPLPYIIYYAHYVDTTFIINIYMAGFSSFQFSHHHRLLPPLFHLLTLPRHTRAILPVTRSPHCRV